MLSDVLVVAATLGEIFESLGVEWLVGGSVASSLLGMPRTTLDLDLVADLQSSDVPAFVRALYGSFYISDHAVRAAILDRGSFNLVHLASMFKVDVFVPQADPLSRVQLQRRCFLEVGPGLRLPVASPEDIIFQKLAWYRKGGGVSERHLRDVAGVITVGSTKLDLDYLHEVAAEAGQTDLLDAALAGRYR